YRTLAPGHGVGHPGRRLIWAHGPGAQWAVSASRNRAAQLHRKDNLSAGGNDRSFTAGSVRRRSIRSAEATPWSKGVNPPKMVQSWRVRGGYVLAVVVLSLARPTLHSILLGAAIGLLGLAIRAYAAGYLQKQEVLTVTGPYARTRNPLYFGSSILALGATVAMNSWWAAALLLIYFTLVYGFVMRREAMELRQKHGDAFDAYAAVVPLFFPKISAGTQEATGHIGFSWQRYKKTREYRAAVGFLL